MKGVLKKTKKQINITLMVGHVEKKNFYDCSQVKDHETPDVFFRE